ncbi:MAG: hypothetical protein H6R19_165 [Proteobacteria bacterium]|nr:hypothetical protein [Pseudomonadota bacterium]
MNMKFVLAASLTILSSAASAEVYLGVGGGITRTNAAERLTQTFADYATVDKKDTSKGTYILFGGYAFNKNFALEASYIDFGKYKASGHDASGTSISDSLDAKAFSIGAVGSYPLGDSFSLDGKLGVGLVSQKYSCLDLACSVLPEKTTKKAVIMGAIGAHWYFSKHVALRAAYEHFGGADYEIERTDGTKFKKTADYGLLYAGAEARF